MLNEDLENDIKWNEYLNYKSSKDYINKKEKEELINFIQNKKYKKICDELVNGKYIFSIPKKHIISKGATNKKRVVYTYNEDEMMLLKYISYVLYDYDYIFSPNLYSFRKNNSVKRAIKNISNIKNIRNMYGYKVDIQNYFNSIDINLLLDNLKKDIKDNALFVLIETILKSEYVEYNNKIITENKGAMAGIPISAFLANYYIK